VELTFVIAFLQIMLIDLILSGDNAVVIGMASRNLPPHQRKIAVLWGTVGAVILRISFTAIAAWLMVVPYLKIIGGVLLLWIAFKLLVQEEEASNIKSGKNVWEAIKTIVAADLIMSLDNVIAIGGAARGDFSLIIFGLLLSIPLLMWGSTVVAKWMNEYPALVYFGSGVLAFTAGTMILEDPALTLPNLNIPNIDIVLPLVIMAITLLFGKAWRARIFGIYHVR
jgi:YjbE family integral membrane protein